VSPNGLELVISVFAAMAAGLINALAGGGTLITFPALVAIGIPAVAANVTNTVALCPGYFGATIAQSKDLRGQRHRFWFVIPAGLIGGLVGAILLINTTEKVFRELIPVLILAASVLLAIQDPVRAWLNRRAARSGSTNNLEPIAALPVGVAAIYGGYFGAGLSVIVLAVLGLVLDDSLTRLNALKQLVALSTNIAAAVFFVFSGKVVWSIAIVMAIGALIGGSLGGKLAGRVNPTVLRWMVVSIGLIIGILYLVKG
jgi:uncharacterized protein